MRWSDLEPVELNLLTPVFLITLAAFGLAVAAMAVGVIFSGRCLHGSCGGPEIRSRDGLSLRCMVCPNRRRRGARIDEHVEHDPIEGGG
jgi:hypothetical protein